MFSLNRVRSEFFPCEQSRALRSIPRRGIASFILGGTDKRRDLLTTTAIFFNWNPKSMVIIGGRHPERGRTTAALPQGGAIVALGKALVKMKSFSHGQCNHLDGRKTRRLMGERG